MSDLKPELWVFCGRAPVYWRMPFYFIPMPNRDQGELRYAILPYTSHRRVVDDVLKQVGAKPFHDFWLIPRTRLEKLATLTTGENPQQFFAWHQDAPLPQPENAPEGRGERSEFTDSLWQKGGTGVSTPEHLYYLWKEFCHHILDTLINKEKSVDMFFLKLHNCPYRVNWQAILCSRFMRLGAHLFRRPQKQRALIVSDLGLSEELLSLDLLSFKRGLKTCRRHVTVEHTRAWWRLSLKAERQRLYRLGNERYASYFLDSVRRFLETGKHLYVEWLAQAKAAMPAHARGELPGTIRFVPYTSGMRSAVVEHNFLPPVIPDRPPPLQSAGVAPFVPGADAGVPEMPAVQSEVENVRDSVGRDVEQSPDGKG